MSRTVREFQAHREKMNSKILAANNLEIRRFFNLDNAVYKGKSLDSKTKELLGLVASTVLRCDDCIAYHIIRCTEEGITNAEFHETISIALVVGGSITIPHVRYAFELWEEMHEQETKDDKKGYQ